MLTNSVEGQERKVTIGWPPWWFDSCIVLLPLITIKSTLADMLPLHILVNKAL